MTMILVIDVCIFKLKTSLRQKEPLFFQIHVFDRRWNDLQEVPKVYQHEKYSIYGCTSGATIVESRWSNVSFWWSNMLHHYWHVYRGWKTALKRQKLDDADNEQTVLTGPKTHKKTSSTFSWWLLAGRMRIRVNFDGSAMVFGELRLRLICLS